MGKGRYVKKESAPFKYNEDNILREIENYISTTYGQHYVDKNNPLGVQMNDIFLSMGTAEDFWKSNAAKYVMRYGRKGGKNRIDLLKAVHYMILLMYLDGTKDKDNP